MDDITNELKSLIFTKIEPGQYMFSDNFNLEDTLPAIDIGNNKMDRGMVKIGDEKLLDFVDSYFKNDLPGKEIDVSELIRMLFRLEMTWYTGKAFFNDTLLTCILMHRDPSVITACTGNKMASLAIEATMTVASLVSYLMSSSPVIREEDFNANLYGMNWWSCTYAGGHFPRFTNNNNNAIVLTETPGEIRLNLLLEELAMVCRQNPNSLDRFYYARLYHWIRFLNEFIKITSISLEFGSIYNLIFDLQSVIGSVEDERELNLEIDDGELVPVIFSELANLFGYGCVRPVRTILPLNTAIRAWNRSLKDDLQGFIGDNLLAGRPPFHELLKRLSERSRDPIKPPILPVFRAILYFSLVQNRFETFYQIEPRDQFITRSLPAPVSLTKLPDLPLLMQDFVQVYSCNPARQRRFLPDLIEFWRERILQKVECGAGHRSKLFFQHFRDLLSIDLILLHGQLKLLSASFGEDLQAAQLISKIFEKFREEGKTEFNRESESGKAESAVVAVPVYDLIRWKRRWSFANQTVEMDNLTTVPESAVNWFKSAVKFGQTAFSLPEPDWQDEIYSTPPPVQQSVGTLFTMYTTEPDNFSSDSEQSE